MNPEGGIYLEGDMKESIIQAIEEALTLLSSKHMHDHMTGFAVSPFTATSLNDSILMDEW